MTDREKLKYLIGFLTGVINGNEHVAALDVKFTREILNNLEES